MRFARRSSVVRPHEPLTAAGVPWSLSDETARCGRETVHHEPDNWLCLQADPIGRSVARDRYPDRLARHSPLKLAAQRIRRCRSRRAHLHTPSHDVSGSTAPGDRPCRRAHRRRWHRDDLVHPGPSRRGSGARARPDRLREAAVLPGPARDRRVPARRLRRHRRHRRLARRSPRATCRTRTSRSPPGVPAAAEDPHAPPGHDERRPVLHADGHRDVAADRRPAHARPAWSSQRTGLSALDMAAYMELGRQGHALEGPAQQHDLLGQQEHPHHVDRRAQVQLGGDVPVASPATSPTATTSSRTTPTIDHDRPAARRRSS